MFIQFDKSKMQDKIYLQAYLKKVSDLIIKIREKNGIIKM